MRSHIILILAASINFTAAGKMLTAGPSASFTAIDTMYNVEINGFRQTIMVQSDDGTNPILLYLHGGPGSSAMFLSHAFSKELRKHFILVHWDQRGSALSYRAGMDAAMISEEQIFRDALELIRHLLKTYNKRKIFLLGHSFGSIIGLRLAAEHPECLQAYIGLGQVMDWERSRAITYRWLENELKKANDSAGMQRMKKGESPLMDLVTKYGGHHHRPVNFDSLIRKSPRYFDGYLELREGARKFTEYHIGRNSAAGSFIPFDVREVTVPLYFFEGKYDRVTACAPELVAEFCRRVKAPVKKIIWFNHSAHWPCLEEPGKFQHELIDTVLKENEK